MAMRSQRLFLRVGSLFPLLILGVCSVAAQSALEVQAIANWPAPLFWNPPADLARPRGEALSEETTRAELHSSAIQSAPSPLPFVAIAPCRMLDTRLTGGAIPSGTTRDVTLTGSPCGIPATAAAVSANFALFNILGTSSNGVLKVWPVGSPSTFQALINWSPTVGQIDNASIVPVGVGGAITVQPNQGTGSIDLVIDVNGYYGGSVVTDVTAGPGLTGGGTGSVTLNLNFGGSGKSATVARGDHVHSTSEIVSGFLADARLAGTYSNALTLSNASNSFTGNGAGLASLDAGSLASGAVPNGRISGLYSSSVNFSNSANLFSGSFSGNGSGIVGVGSVQRPSFAITSLDTPGNVGLYSSSAIGTDGLPVISYLDGSNFDLKIAHCANIACTAATTATLDSAGNVGYFTSIAIGSDGLPLISYYDITNGRLKAAHCLTIPCSSAGISSVASGGNVGEYSSLAIGVDGLPLISYYDVTNGDLKVAHCFNATCSSGAASFTLDSGGDVGQFSSLTIGADGLGFISYYDATNTALKAAHCSDIPCSSATVRTLASLGNIGQYSAVTIGVDGLPLISFFATVPTPHLRVAHCDDVACSSGVGTSVDSTGNVLYTSISVGPDGLGVISYYDATNGDLKAAHCLNADCSRSTTATVDAAGNVGYFTSLVVGSDGLPLISYYDVTNQDLKVVHCSNPACAPHIRRR